MPMSTPSIPHASARALFAQDCTHDTHYLNHKGDLYTALITGGNRVLMLKNGTVVAQSGPLFDHSAPMLGAAAPSHDIHTPPNSTSGVKNAPFSASSAALASTWRTPCVYVVNICRFTDDVLRLAVATTAGIFVFEFDDAGILWQDTRPSSFWRTADRDGEDGVFDAGATSATAGNAGSPTNRYPAVHGRGSLFQPAGASPLGLRSTASRAAAGGPSPTSANPSSTEAHLKKHSGMSGRLRWRRVAFSLEPPQQRSVTASTTAAASAAAALLSRGSSAYASPYRGSASSNLSTNMTGTGRSVTIAPVRVAAPSRPSAVRAMDFVSEDALCVVLETETVLIVLGNSSIATSRNLYGTGGLAPVTTTTTTTGAPHVADRVVWRSLGAYRSLAVCRVNHHIALALGHSSIVVFPSRTLTANGGDTASGLPGDDDGGRASTAFSTVASSFFTTHASSGEASPKLMPAAIAGTMRGMFSESRSSSIVPTPAFSPTNPPMAVPGLLGDGLSAFHPSPVGGSGNGAAGTLGRPYITLAKQGLTASVGMYHITDMRWHRVSAHTLLCVTCCHPREEAAFMMLYTVQSLSSTRRYTNVMEEHADGGWGLCRGGYDGDGVMDGSGGLAAKASESLVQLVPAGVIALTYTSTAPSAGPTPHPRNTAALMATNTAFAAAEALTDSVRQTATNTPNHSALSAGTVATTTWGGAPPPPVAEMHTSLVPNFSRSAEANSMGSRMEFLHVEGDGTVRTSSYAFGRQKHASFAKQRAVGLACTELLQPLQQLYGSLVRVTVLPTWRTRPIELGHHTGKQPQVVEVLLNASRRYRLILRFTSGVLLSVMVDLSAAVYRVESYLAIGRATLLSLRPILPIPELDADAANVMLSQTAIGTTTMLLAGLLDFPNPTSPPAGKPRRLLAASPSFLEEGEVDTWRHTKLSKASLSSSASSAASVPPSSSTSSTNGGVKQAPLFSPSPRTVWGVVLLQVEPSGLQARVLTIAPLSDVDSVRGVADALAAEARAARDAYGGDASGSRAAGPASSEATKVASSAGDVSPAAVTEADVKLFITEKCPEKLKFMPALLKATQQDAGRLLTQLTAKYGPLEKTLCGPQCYTMAAEAPGKNAADAPLTPPSAPRENAMRSLASASLSPSVLRSGCVTEAGDVVLLLAAQSDYMAESSDSGLGSAAAAVAVVRIRPPCLETFAPVQRLVAAGCSQVPFVPVSAEYTAIPAALQQRWWPQSSPASLSSSAPSTQGMSADVQGVYTAFRLCCRVSVRLRETRAVQCKVVGTDPATPAHVCVRSPLTPEGEAASGLTASQYFVLPDGVAVAAETTSAGRSIEAPLLVDEMKGMLQVNNDVVVGVLCRSARPQPRERDASSQLPATKPPTSSPSLSVGVSHAQVESALYLYGCPAVQSLAAATCTAQPGSPSASSAKATPPSAFKLEAVLSSVEAFYLSTSGEVVVLRRTDSPIASSSAPQGPAAHMQKSKGNTAESTAIQGVRFERWLRCFPAGDSSGSSHDGAAPASRRDGVSPAPEGQSEKTDHGYSYTQDLTWCPPCSHSRGSAWGDNSSLTAVTTMEVAGAWEANVVGLSTAAKLASSRADTRPVLYSMSDNSFIHLRQVPLRRGGDAERRPTELAQRDKRKDANVWSHGGTKGVSTALAGMPQYHPDAVMQLIGMARWSVLAKVLSLVLSSAKAALSAAQPPSTSSSEPLTFFFSQPPDELARRLCTSAVARGFRDRPQVVQYDDMLQRVTPPRLSAEALQDDIEMGVATAKASTSSNAPAVARRLYDLTATCGSLFTDLTEVLPQVTLTGLSSHEQLNLLCIVQSLRDTLPLSRSVDEAAARYLFFTRLMSLGRRLRLPNIDISAAGAAAAAAIPGVPINSVLYFEVGRTATRTVSTAAYLWAAMSDSQSTLVSMLFDKSNAMYLDGGVGANSANLGAGEVTWEQVEQSGAAFWLRSASDLRAMADRVARHQYQRNKELTACALMYCTARKVSTLAALAKAQNNMRLHAFFSRDFAHDEHHRAAASANAYAAISKNLPHYGAAFFLLAGDVRSAVQVVLQRCRDPSLALFVLRAAGEDMEEAAVLSGEGHGDAANRDAPLSRSSAAPAETLLQWYAKQRASEADACGPLDMWETACLSWMDVTQQTTPDVAVQRRIAALQRIAAHPTAHPEALCALRYARDGVAALAYRGNQFLSAAREVVCLLRLGRYCLAHRLNLNGYLHYRDAEELLRSLRAEAARQRGLETGDADTTSVALTRQGGSARRPTAQAKMAADYNTGTLTFCGFDSDDEDDGHDDGGGGRIMRSRAGQAGISVGGEAAVAQDAVEEETFVLSDEAAAAVQAEMQYAYARTGAWQGPGADTAGPRMAALSTAAATSTSYEDVLRHMLLCFTAASSFMSTSTVSLREAVEGATTAATTPSLAGTSHGPFQELLTQLLRRLISDMPGGRPTDTETVVSYARRAGAPATRASSRSPAEELLSLPTPLGGNAAVAGEPTTASPLASASTSRPELNGSIREPLKCAAEGWYSLCIPLLHLLLGKVALQEANYLVLLCLQRIPVSAEGVLEAAEKAGLLRGIFSCSAEGGASSITPKKLSPLYLPLIAFFRLLGQYIVHDYREACEAEEEQQGTHAGVSKTSKILAHKLGGMEARENSGVDGDAGDDPVHQNIFEALMAAAAVAERSASQSGASSPGLRDGGARRSTYPFDGNGGSSNTMEGADDEDVLGGDGSMSSVTADAQVAFLLSCCQSQLQLRLLEHLRQLTRAELQAAVHTPTTQRAVDAGVLYSDPLSPGQQAMLIQRRVLLATMLLDVTAQWVSLSEETMLRLYTALPQYSPGPLTDPNGVFLEVRMDVIRMRAVLVTLLAGPRGVTEAAAVAATLESADGSTSQPTGGEGQPPALVSQTNQTMASGIGSASQGMSTTTWLEENTLMLLELCTTQLELYWALPSHALTQCRVLASPTRAALRLLQRHTASHATARKLLGGMLRPLRESPVLSQRSHSVPLASQHQQQLQDSSPSSPLGRAPSAAWPAGNETPSPVQAKRTDEDTNEMYCPALSFLQLAWMRRHHTHALLRWLLLGITLDMGRDEGQRPLVTDRLILTQHNHAVTGVQFDASSCDSVVCTSEAGTSVGHGVRELLAGDNEEALSVRSTERNLATAAFTLGLAAQQERLRITAEHNEGVHTPEIVAALTAKSVLENRPRCAVAANAMPSTHPHLPFFLARHRDGHLDLYPYASQECIASFCCALRHGQGGSSGGSLRRSASPITWAAWGVGPSAGSALSGVTGAGGAASSGYAHSSTSQTAGQRMERYAVTPVAFSPNGYIIAAGLSDGSVAGWRFAAAAVESAPAFMFPQLFAPFGIRACAFCGDRSSLMVVVGLVREPHPHRRARIEDGAARLANQAATVASRVRGTMPARPVTLSTSFAMSPVSPSALSGVRGSPASPTAVGELVGEVMILDTMMDGGAVTARCALPFVPSYAVYLNALRAVLMVSSEGLMATYSLPSGQLAVIATLPVSTVLKTLAGSPYGGGGPAASGGSGTAAAKAATAAAAAGGGTDDGAVLVTCVTKSAYDPLVALGTSKGLVLVLHLRHISAAIAEAERRVREDGEDVFVYYPPAAGSSAQTANTAAGKRLFNAPASTPVSATSRAGAEMPAPAMGTEFLNRLPQESVLTEATCVQVAPQVQSRGAVQDLVFSPSMLLAGLRDGKVMAVAIIAQATRARLTAGSSVSVGLLEPVGSEA